MSSSRGVPERPQARPRQKAKRPRSVSARRLRLVRGGMVLLVLALSARLFQIQVFGASRYESAATAQLSKTIDIPALRGGIYDRNGGVLSLSIPTKDLIADDFQVVGAHKVSDAVELSSMLSIPVAQMLDLLSRNSGYVVLAKNVPLTLAATVMAKGYPFLTTADDSIRRSPNGELAASVLGFTNWTGHGSSGLEYQYDTTLAGAPGKKTVLESPLGFQLPGSRVTVNSTPVEGKGLELTLDAPLQYETERALGAQLRASNAVSGTAIIMDSRTGEILSQANLVNMAYAHLTGPLQAPAAIATSHPVVPGVAESMNNLALTQLYEPGSVFKLVPFSAALTAGAITPQSRFTIPGSMTLDGYTFHDAEAHGTINLSATDVLAQSSNLGTFQIAQAAGEQNLLNEVTTLGFGKPTGLGFPGESRGLLVGTNSWSTTDIVSLPIGQVDAVNAQQVLDAYNVVANGGVFVAPKLVRATVSSTGGAVPTPASNGYRAMPYGLSKEITQMLQQVVLSGTGTNAVVPGYSVAGKTGTAQIPQPGSANYLPGDYMATFVGFAPAQNPVLTAIVVINRPTPVFFGGLVAAPVFSQIMSYALHRYGIPTTPGAPTQITQLSTNLAQDVTGAGAVR